MTQHNDNDFQQFRGKFDDAMTLNSSFAARMEKLLQSENPIQNERISTVLASPSSPQTVTPSARRSHPLMIAAAVLILFAVVTSSVYLLSGGMLDREYASAPAGMATLPADAKGTPGADVQLQAERLSDIPEVRQSFGMHDGVLILRIPADLSNQQSEDSNVYSDSLVAVDPESGAIVWEHPFYGFEAIGSSNGILIGRELAPQEGGAPGEHEPVRVALDLESGDQLWSAKVEDTDYWGSYRNTFISNDVVIDMLKNSKLIARDLTNGEVVWESEYDPGIGWEQQVTDHNTGETRTERWYSVAATEWNGMVVIINGEGQIQIIDPVTGKRTDSYQFDWSNIENRNHASLELFPTAHGVLLYRQTPGDGNLRYSLTAFDPRDGSTLWEIEGDGQQFVTPMSDGRVALQSVQWESSNWFQQLFGNHGHTIHSLTLVNGNTGETLLKTEPGVLEEGPAYVVSDGDYVCVKSDTSTITCYDSVGTRYILETATFDSFDVVDGALYAPTHGGLFRAELP